MLFRRTARRSIIVEMAEYVLLPGLDGTGDLFDPLISVIPSSNGVTRMAYDREVPHSIPSYADQVLSVANGLDDKVVVAESFSSLVLLELLRRGTRPRAAVFCAGFADSPRPFLLRASMWLPMAAIMRIKLRPLALRMACLGMAASDSLVEHTRQVISSVNPEVLAYRLRQVATAQAPNLRMPEVPILYLRAINDRLVPARSADWFRRNVRGLQVQELVGPHFLLQANPVESWDAIRCFSDRLGP